MNIYSNVLHSLYYADPYNSLNENMYGSVHDILTKKSKLFKNKVFVLSGKYSHFDIKKLILNNNGTVKSKIDPKVNYLVVPHDSDKPSKKLNYVKKNKQNLRCKVITDVEVVKRVHRFFIK